MSQTNNDRKEGTGMNTFEKKINEIIELAEAIERTKDGVKLKIDINKIEIVELFHLDLMTYKYFVRKWEIKRWNRDEFIEATEISKNTFKRLYNLSILEKETRLL